MTRQEVFNFAAGPAVLPQAVLEKARDSLLDYNGSGMSVMELTHRGPDFQEIIDSASEGLKKLLSIPDTHDVLFLQGGATGQFAAIPMNLSGGRSVSYAVTGNFSKKAAAEAAKYAKVNVAADVSSSGFSRIPEQLELNIPADDAYFYYCANNTIYGTEWQYVPESPVPLVCDMSSDILSRSVDVSKYALIFAGAQKNIAPAGVTVVILDKSLAGNEMPITPAVLSYKVMLESGSMMNTPPCWCIYMIRLVTEWLEAQGGIAAMDELKRIRSGMLYDFLDGSSLFKPHAVPGSRSFMNVTFSTGSRELDAEFIAAASKQGLVNLKGHKVAGGMRASMYNAMPVEGAVKLVEFMKKFEVEHHV